MEGGGLAVILLLADGIITTARRSNVPGADGVWGSWVEGGSVEMIPDASADEIPGKVTEAMVGILEGIPGNVTEERPVGSCEGMPPFASSEGDGEGAPVRGIHVVEFAAPVVL